jgi:hypothetical protein
MSGNGDTAGAIVRGIRAGVGDVGSTDRECSADWEVAGGGMSALPDDRKYALLQSATALIGPVVTTEEQAVKIAKKLLELIEAE